LVEKLICFELNVENECQGKVTSKQESPSFSLGKMSKGHADIYIFFSLHFVPEQKFAKANRVSFSDGNLF